jgi:hypothetical protein
MKICRAEQVFKVGVMNMKRGVIQAVYLCLLTGAVQAANVTFTGSSDCKFLTAANWDQAPVSKDTLSI